MNGRPVRVLSISPELPSPGNAGTMAATARQLDSLRRLGVELHVLDMKGIPKLKYLQAVPRMQSLLRQVDLVHAHYGYCGWLARMQVRKPIVMSYMGSDLLGETSASGGLDWFSRAMIPPNRWLARIVKAVIVKSREMAKLVEPIEAHVIPNGVDIETFQPQDKEEARRELGWGLDDHYVLFPGNPDTPRKNYPLASEAVHHASEELGRPLKLVPLRNVAPDEVALYMNACDAMVMTSFIEGSPNVVKEAMACDLPVAGVPVGDVPEMLADVPGYGVCPRDPRQLGNLLVELLRCPRQQVQGRKAILTRRLDLEGVAQQVLQIYEDVLGLPLSSDVTSEKHHHQNLAVCAR